MVQVDTPKQTNLNKYHSTFMCSIQYGMTPHDWHSFIANQYNEIYDVIEKAMEFVDRYNFGDDTEYIRTYAVAVLPFMIFDGKIEEPKKLTKKSYEDALQWLKYIRENHGMAKHHIYTITTDKRIEGDPPVAFDDFTGFDMDKVNEHIGYYEFLAQIDVGREKRTWWGSSGALASVMNLAYVVYLAWSVEKEDGTRKAEQDRILAFLYEYFDEIGYSIKLDSIRTHIYNEAKKNTYITGNPYWTADNLL